MPPPKAGKKGTKSNLRKYTKIQPAITYPAAAQKPPPRLKNQPIKRQTPTKIPKTSPYAKKNQNKLEKKSAIT